MEFGVLGACHDGATVRIVFAEPTGHLLTHYRFAAPRLETFDPGPVVEPIVEMAHKINEYCGVELPVLGLCLGAVDCERADVRDALHQALRESGVAQDITVTTDTVIALVGAHGLQPGVLVSADRSAVVMGAEESETGLTITSADGWGPLVGDEGSAVWIGLQSLRAAMRHVDDRGPATTMTERILTTLGVQSPRDLVDILSLRGEGLEHILEVFPLCMKAAEEKDAVALAIAQEAAQALAQSCAAILERLEEPGPVALAGSVFGYAWMRDEFERRLAKLSPGACLQDPILPPEVGAALMALTRYFPFEDHPDGLADLVDTLSLSWEENGAIAEDGRTEQ